MKDCESVYSAGARIYPLSMRNPVHILLLFAPLLLALAFSACERRKDHPAEPTTPLAQTEQPVTGAQVGKEAKEALKTTGQFLSQESEEAAAKLKKGMEELQPKVSELKERTGKAAEEAKDSLSKAARDLNINSDTAKARLEEFKDASAQELQKLKDRVAAERAEADRRQEEKQREPR